MTVANPIPVERVPEPAPEPRGPGDYVVPLVHVKVPPRVVDVGFWAAAGTVAVVGVLNLPAAGIAAAGLYLLRARHEESCSGEE
jgi:hypothetical protein